MRAEEVAEAAWIDFVGERDLTDAFREAIGSSGVDVSIGATLDLAPGERIDAGSMWAWKRGWPYERVIEVISPAIDDFCARHVGWVVTEVRRAYSPPA